MPKSIVDAITRMRDGKREWRAYQARVKALPHDYAVVMDQIMKFLWNFASDASGMGPMTVMYGILDLFEESAAAGRPVLDVTGDDVAGFVWNVIVETQTATWTGDKSAKLNATIHKLVGRPGGAATPSDKENPS